MSERSFVRRFVAIAAAAALAPPLTTFIWGLPLLFESPAFVLLALVLSLPFGFLGAFLFLAPALAAAEGLGARSRGCAGAGAAAGLAHVLLGGLFAAAAGSPGAVPMLVAGLLLPAAAAGMGLLYPWLMIAAPAAGAASGWLYSNILQLDEPPL